MGRRNIHKRAAAGCVSSLVLATSLAVTWLSGPAGADTFSGGGAATGWQADNGVHTFCFATTDVTIKDESRKIMNNALDSPTDMSDEEHASCDSQIDVWFRREDLPAGTRGTYTCEWLNGSRCNRSSVRIDEDEIRIGSNDIEDIDKTICHEIGHSVGLTHGGTTDCMRNGEIPDTSSQWRNYDAHHRGHINNAY